MEVGHLERGRSHITPSHRSRQEVMWQWQTGGKAIALVNQGGVAEGTKGDVAEQTAPLLWL
ncbi:UNVERIFIED_CONTAM: hypothetical protein FKN15_015625 [Acipenser sinensis]